MNIAIAIAELEATRNHTPTPLMHGSYALAVLQILHAITSAKKNIKRSETHLHNSEVDGHGFRRHEHIDRYGIARLQANLEQSVCHPACECLR